MSGFLFWVILVITLLFVFVGVGFYIRDRLREENQNTYETPIFGLKASTFYIISLLSLILLFCLYDNPISTKWKVQRSLDSCQNKLIDSLKAENNLLRTNMKDIRDLLDLNHQLDEKIICNMGKRDVIVINNHQKQHRKHLCRRDSMICDSIRKCNNNCKYPICPNSRQCN